MALDIAAWLLPTDSPGQRTVQTWDQMTDERERESDLLGQ